MLPLCLSLQTEGLLTKASAKWFSIKILFFNVLDMKSDLTLKLGHTLDFMTNLGCLFLEKNVLESKFSTFQYLKYTACLSMASATEMSNCHIKFVIIYMNFVIFVHLFIFT